jgi:glutathione S-transferase
MSSTVPVLRHDPTSEPSRAVHWLCLAAGIPIEVRHVWLTRGEHRAESFLKVNPRHQVPALGHGDFNLSEATAIMGYLAELHGCAGRWLGDSTRARAEIQMLLSWYHTNLRLRVTIHYFLPILLMPAYFGTPHADPDEVARVRDAFDEVFEQLDNFLAGSPFLAGDEVTAPDLLFAAELFALDMDPERDIYLEPHLRVLAWLERMRTVTGYEVSHAPWNHVVPMVKDRWRRAPAEGWDPAWVAEECQKVLGSSVRGT